MESTGRFRSIRGGRASEYTQKTQFDRGEKHFDGTLLIIVLFLLGFGMIMIYSSSSYKGVLSFGDGMYYLKKQIIANVIGLVIMLIISRIPYHFWERISFPAIGVSVVLIILIVPFGQRINGAKRWLGVGSFSLQPAEVAKLAVIMFLAWFICRLGREIEKFSGWFKFFLAPGVLAIMVWRITDNLSSALIILGIAVAIMFVANPHYKIFIALAGVGSLIVYLIIRFAVNSASEAGEMGFRFQRVLAWLNPEAYADGKGFQTLQALYAIGSGGLFGKGLGESMQKLGNVPEAQNDMIFSIVCEELGIVGALVLLLMFGLLIWRCAFIARNAPDLYGALLVCGVLGHLAIQVILNVAVCTNLMPNTGISLPFISYGGSSVVFLLAEIGIVLSVGRGIEFAAD